MSNIGTLIGKVVDKCKAFLSSGFRMKGGLSLEMVVSIFIEAGSETCNLRLERSCHCETLMGLWHCQLLLTKLGLQAVSRKQKYVDFIPPTHCIVH
jgi:hypothetical protein